MNRIFNFQNLRLVHKDRGTNAPVVRATRSNTTFDFTGTESEQLQQIVQISRNQIDDTQSSSGTPDTSDELSTDNSIEVIPPVHPEEQESQPDHSAQNVNDDTPTVTCVYPDLSVLEEENSVPPPPVIEPQLLSSQLNTALTPSSPDSVSAETAATDSLLAITSSSSPSVTDSSHPPNVDDSGKTSVQFAIQDPFLIKCAEIDLQLSVQTAQHNSELQDQIINIIPELFTRNIDLHGFPSLHAYITNAVGVSPGGDSARFAVESFLSAFPQLSLVAPLILHTVKYGLTAISDPRAVEFCDVQGTIDEVLQETLQSGALTDNDRDSGDSSDDSDETSDSGQSDQTSPKIVNTQDPPVEDNSLQKAVTQLQAQSTTGACLQSETHNSLDIQLANTCDSLNSHIRQIDTSLEHIEHIFDPIPVTTGTKPSPLEPVTAAALSKNKETLCDTNDTPQNRSVLHEIIHHPQGFQPPPTDITIAAGARVGPNPPVNMAQNRRNAQAQLQGADPALVNILNQLVANDARRDVSSKKFLMFPKSSFTGEDNSLARTHWTDFVKYIDYQHSQNLIDRQRINDVKAMFKLSLTGHALAWFEVEQAAIRTEQALGEAFLKRFNVWGQTHRQQNSAWNKLSFDIQKDDVDIFLSDLKLLASILRYNDTQILEKFKEVFPGQIEAGLLNTDNIADAQAQAKQLVQIYKTDAPAGSTTATVLAHTLQNTTLTESTENDSDQVHEHTLTPVDTDQHTVPQTRSQGHSNRGRDNPRGPKGFRGSFRGGFRGNGPRRASGAHYNTQTHSFRGRGNFSSRGQSSNGRFQPRFPRYGGRGHYSPRGRGQYSQGQTSPRYQQNAYPYNPINSPATGYNPTPAIIPPVLSAQPQSQQVSMPTYSPGAPQYPQVTGYAQTPPPYTGPQSMPPQYSMQSQQTTTKQAANTCSLCHATGHYDTQCEYAADFLRRTRDTFKRAQGGYIHESDEYYQEEDQYPSIDNNNNQQGNQHQQPFQ